MPEGPEVWRMQQRLKSIEGTTINLIVGKPHKNLPSVKDIGRVQGKRVVEVRRVGKRIGVQLSDNTFVVCTAGMTGNWFERPRNSPVKPGYDLAVILPSRGTFEYVFRDTRRFGGIRVANEGWAADLGTDFTDPLLLEPEAEAALRNDFTVRYKRRAIKEALLDQGVIAGIGNVYASEILWHLRVNPHRPVADFDRFRALGVATHRILMRACSGKGVADGRKTVKYQARQVPRGGYEVRAYDQANEPCYRCDTPIASAQLGGRSTYWCPQCQAE